MAAATLYLWQSRPAGARGGGRTGQDAQHVGITWRRQSPLPTYERCYGNHREIWEGQVLMVCALRNLNGNSMDSCGLVHCFLALPSLMAASSRRKIRRKKAIPASVLAG